MDGCEEEWSGEYDIARLERDARPDKNVTMAVRTETVCGKCGAKLANV